MPVRRAAGASVMGEGSAAVPRAGDGLGRLVAAWRSAGEGSVLVVTGAGVSLASGISTFRGTDSGAIWRECDIAMATVEYFDRDPVGQWRWYLERFRRLDDAEPNAAHHALARLETLQQERGGTLTLVTQNIDQLHERAGSRRLIKIHGTSSRVRCSRAGCENGAPRGSLPRAACDLAAFVERPSTDTLPRCPRCGSPLRAHVLFFDEYYQDHVDYRLDDALAAAETAEVMLFAGTSFSVGITDLVGRAAHARRVPIFSIDPNPAPQAGAYGVTAIAAPAEELLPALIDELAGRQENP